VSSLEFPMAIGTSIKFFDPVSLTTNALHEGKRFWTSRTVDAAPEILFRRFEIATPADQFHNDFRWKWVYIGTCIRWRFLMSRRLGVWQRFVLHGGRCEDGTRRQLIWRLWYRGGGRRCCTWNASNRNHSLHAPLLYLRQRPLTTFPNGSLKDQSNCCHTVRMFTRGRAFDDFGDQSAMDQRFQFGPEKLVFHVSDILVVRSEGGK